jgi:hypothetical protein
MEFADTGELVSGPQPEWSRLSVRRRSCSRDTGELVPGPQPEWPYTSTKLWRIA